VIKKKEMKCTYWNVINICLWSDKVIIKMFSSAKVTYMFEQSQPQFSRERFIMEIAF